jgi:peroxiredoxin
MYDVENPEREGRAQRISFVIAPGGDIIFAHSDRDPIAHVNGAKDAVINWAAEN